MKVLCTILLMLITNRTVYTQKSVAVDSVKIDFTIRNAGFNVHGTMGGGKAQIEFDPAHPAAAKISGSADPNTISTGNATRDRHLKRSDYFDVQNFPEIKIASQRVQQTEPGKYTGTFLLTIKNTSKSITMPFTYSQEGNKCVFKAEMQIDRLDFKVGESSIILSDNVKINVEITGTR